METKCGCPSQLAKTPSQSSARTHLRHNVIFHPGRDLIKSFLCNNARHPPTTNTNLLNNFSETFFKACSEISGMGGLDYQRNETSLTPSAVRWQSTHRQPIIPHLICLSDHFRPWHRASLFGFGTEMGNARLQICLC